ncbi:MAG: AAA family ATPase [Sedimentisphaerales bacterium]|jgi:pilus assembly protein CpaE
MSKSEIEILLVTQDQKFADTVKGLFAENKNFLLANIYQDLSQLRSCLSRSKEQAVVVDIDPSPTQMLRSIGMICDISPETFVVIVCSHHTKELILQAMRSGARHFLEKKTLASELLKELQGLVHEDRIRAMDSDTSVIPVFSSGGGCGATTVAINLAGELRLLTGRQVLAIDLDTCYGAVSSYLGIKSQYGIADVLASKNDVIDIDLIRSSACAYKDNFHVLTSPAGLTSWGSKVLRYENLSRTIEVCRQAYGYTIIDAPRLSPSVAVELAKLSDIVVVVFQLTVKDVHSTRSILSALTEAGIARERIIPLANRVRKRGPLVKLEDTKRVLGLSACRTIRSDWRKAMKSVNHGKLLIEAVKRSGLRKDIRALAINVRARGKNGNSKTLR